MLGIEPKNAAGLRRVHASAKQRDALITNAGAVVVLTNLQQILRFSIRFFEAFARGDLNRLLARLNHASNELEQPRILAFVEHAHTNLPH